MIYGSGHIDRFYPIAGCQRIQPICLLHFKVTLLVNNAGYVYGRTLMDLPDNEIERTFKINILSHYWVSKNF